MKQFLLDILADPGDNKPLIPEGETSLLNPATANRYPVNDQIPNLLKEQLSIPSSDQIQNESLFDYRTHYETDATAFDYFEPEKSTVTLQERSRSRQSILHSISSDAKTILDIGCGSAWVAAKLLPKGKKVISMDISSTNPRRAMETYPHPNHAAIVADAFFLPFQNKTLDVVIASEVLEHLEDPGTFISRVCEKIKPGGKLILVTPYNETIEYYLCIHCNRPTPKNAHFHSFNEKNISNYIQVKGVTVKTKAFCNKYVLKLRLYNLFSFLPFNAWNFVDTIANSILKKPTTFRIEITKQL